MHNTFNSNPFNLKLITASLGTHVVNNKIWFLNNQITNIVNSEPLFKGFGMLSDTTWIENKLKDKYRKTIQLNTNQIYHSNFNVGITQNRIGAIFLIILTSIITIIGIVINFYF